MRKDPLHKNRDRKEYGRSQKEDREDCLTHVGEEGQGEVALYLQYQMEEDSAERKNG